MAGEKVATFIHFRLEPIYRVHVYKTLVVLKYTMKRLKIVLDAMSRNFALAVLPSPRRGSRYAKVLLRATLLLKDYFFFFGTFFVANLSEKKKKTCSI